MGDARFFARRTSRALTTIATAAGGSTPAIERQFSGVAPLQTAGPDEVSFLDNRRYAALLEHTLAGAVIVHPDMLARVPAATIPIITTTAYEAWARIAALFHPPSTFLSGRPRHASALIAETAQVDGSAEFGAYVVIEAGAEISVGPFASIGKG
jgi:UDP-3-O-[3-hydroxymyristoyl] glucosamine N-acyltransferase